MIRAAWADPLATMERRLETVERHLAAGSWSSLEDLPPLALPDDLPPPTSAERAAAEALLVRIEACRTVAAGRRDDVATELTQARRKRGAGRRYLRDASAVGRT